MALDKSRSFSEQNLGFQQFLLLQYSSEAEGKLEEGLFSGFGPTLMPLHFLSVVLFRNSYSVMSD